MNKLTIINELRQRLATTTVEAPYCIMPRSLLAATIDAIAHAEQPAADPFIGAIRRRTTPKEYLILTCLDDADGAVVDIPTLMHAANIKREPALWVHIARLRAKTKNFGWGAIHSVRGEGYLWLRPAEQRRPLQFNVDGEEIG